MDVDMILEIPARSRNKYEMHPRSGPIPLDSTLFTATSYPVRRGCAARG